jgi:hypothetical protein
MTDVNKVAYIFWLPFYVVGQLVKGYGLLPWQIGLPLILAVLVALLLGTLSEAGPFRIATICRRFSWIGIPVGTFVLWWCWCSYMFVRDSSSDTGSVLLSGLILLVLVYWSYFCYYVIFRAHLHKAIVRSAYRRMRFRLRWESIARAAGMVHERDVRPHGWWLGGVTIIRQRALIVQWVPTLWHGRRGDDPSIVHYLIRPARGLSADTWVDPRSGEGKVELQNAIAIAAGAINASISKAEDKRNWWTLTLFWKPVETYRETM